MKEMQTEVPCLQATTDQLQLIVTTVVVGNDSCPGTATSVRPNYTKQDETMMVAHYFLFIHHFVLSQHTQPDASDIIPENFKCYRYP